MSDNLPELTFHQGEMGPVYGTVPLIADLPISGGYLLAMPSKIDLLGAKKDHLRLVGGYEVLLSHYLELRKQQLRKQLEAITKGGVS